MIVFVYHQQADRSLCLECDSVQSGQNYVKGSDGIKSTQLHKEGEKIAVDNPSLTLQQLHRIDIMLVKTIRISLYSHSLLQTLWPIQGEGRGTGNNE